MQEAIKRRIAQDICDYASHYTYNVRQFMVYEATYGTVYAVSPPFGALFNHFLLTRWCSNDISKCKHTQAHSTHPCTLHIHEVSIMFGKYILPLNFWFDLHTYTRICVPMIYAKWWIFEFDDFSFKKRAEINRSLLHVQGTGTYISHIYVIHV